MENPALTASGEPGGHGPPRISVSATLRDTRGIDSVRGHCPPSLPARFASAANRARAISGLIFFVHLFRHCRCGYCQYGFPRDCIYSLTSVIGLPARGLMRCAPEYGRNTSARVEEDKGKKTWSEKWIAGKRLIPPARNPLSMNNLSRDGYCRKYRFSMRFWMTHWPLSRTIVYCSRRRCTTPVFDLT